MFVITKLRKHSSLAIEHFEEIDVLHNNLGIAPAGGPLYIGDALFQKTMDTHVGSILRTTRAVSPHFRKQGSGVMDTPLVYQQIAAQYDSMKHIKEQRTNVVPMNRRETP